jgi:hypothetical protein
MFRPEPKLAAVPQQPTSREREQIPAGRTWTFTDRTTGQPQMVTCLPGCVVDHAIDMATPTHPQDVWCMGDPKNVYLPINEGGSPEEFRVLGSYIRQEPFSRNWHERVPHAVVEVVDDHFIEGLDPDGLATVILTLESQLAVMRQVHAQLVELRAQGRVQL